MMLQLEKLFTKKGELKNDALDELNKILQSGNSTDTVLKDVAKEFEAQVKALKELSALEGKVTWEYENGEVKMQLKKGVSDPEAAALINRYNNMPLDPSLVKEAVIKIKNGTGDSKYVDLFFLVHRNATQMVTGKYGFDLKKIEAGLEMEMLMFAERNVYLESSGGKTIAAAIEMITRSLWGAEARDNSLNFKKNMDMIVRKGEESSKYSELNGLFDKFGLDLTLADTRNEMGKERLLEDFNNPKKVVLIDDVSFAHLRN